MRLEFARRSLCLKRALQTSYGELTERELLAVISGEADRLARIVNDILWASRLDSGQMGVAIVSCDAAQLGNAVASVARAHVPVGVEVSVDAPDGLPHVAADPDKLRQVLTNLVDNAVKYSPDGGSVRIGLTQSGNCIRFRIEDQGLGIPPAEHGRIFEKFYRLDPNLTRGVGGTGLGLYISHARAHLGRLRRPARVDLHDRAAARELTRGLAPPRHGTERLRTRRRAGRQGRRRP